MIHPIKLIACVLMLVGAPAVAGAATYYVDDLDTNCAPAAPGTGTLADPWKNLMYATKRLACGDTLKMRRGTYRSEAQGYSNGACSVVNGEYAVAYFAQRCTASNPITVEPYNGELVILDATSAQIDDASPSSHWTRCESANQCGSCTGLSLKDYTRTFYSEPYNFSSANTEQLWVDPQCNDADDSSCTDPANTGTRLRWIGTNYPGCANLNNLDGACDTAWSSPACGTFDTGAISNSIVVRLPDTMSNPDPDTHRMKVSCQGGTCATAPLRFSGATNINFNGGGTTYIKYGYNGITADSSAQDAVISGVRIHAAGGRDYGQCIRTGSANNITLRNSVCSESGAEGIGFYGGGHGSCRQISGNVVEGTTIYNTGFASATNRIGSVLDDGIIIKSCNNCVARGNTIYNNGRNGIEVTSNWNGSTLCDSDGTLIENNVIHHSCNSIHAYMNSDCGGVHLVRPGGTSGSIDNSTVRNNVFYDILGLKTDVSPHGVKVDSGIGQTAIVSNSFRNIAQECIDTNEDNSQPAGNFIVKDNAMYKCNSENVGGQGYVHMNAASDWVHAKNLYWDDANVAIVRINNGTAYFRDSLVAQWEPSAIVANPLFTSATDLRLAATSPGIDKGENLSTLGFGTDFEGDARPQGAGWDVGADELSDGGVPRPPALLSVDPLP
jgi:parallel beta-helix repeat protein